MNLQQLKVSSGSREKVSTSCFTNRDNPLYTDTRYNDKILYNDNLTHETFAYEVTTIHNLCKNIVFNTLKKHMFSIFVRIVSVRYPKHVFYEGIRIKQELSYI